MIKFRLLIILILITLINISVIALPSEQYNVEYLDQQQMMSLNKFSREYFYYKGIRNLVFITCNYKDSSASVLKNNATIVENNFSNSNIKFLKDFIKFGFLLKIFQLNKIKPEDFTLNRAYRTGIIIDGFNDNDCTPSMSHEILKIADKKNLFTTNNFWFLRTNDLESIDIIFENVFVPPDGDVKILIPIRRKKSMPFTDNVIDDKNILAQEDNRIIRFENLQWMLVDVYRIVSYKKLKIEILSENIISAAGMIDTLKKIGIFTARRKNFDNIKILCGVVIEFPDAFTTFEDVKTKHINTISKVNYPLMTNLRHDLNFRFNLMQMDSYGWKHSDGKFDGMVGQFQRNGLDFGVNALFMRLDRVPIVDFVAETFNIRACVIFRQPPLSAVENIFTLPFALDVWISCLVFIITVIIILATQLLFHPIKLDMNYWDCAVFVWGAVCQQGFHLNIYTASGRYIVFTTFISALFLFTSFSANIVALLQTPSEAIKTISDLTHSPLDAAVQDVKYNKIYFKEITDPVTQALYHKKIAPKGENAFIRPHQGMEKVRSGLFAYQVESQAAYQIISDTYNEHEKCGLKELELFQLPVMSIPVKKTFPYKELFRQRLRWQRENGLMNREFRKWFPARPQCENKVAGFVSIGLTESRYPLLYFGSGIGIAFGIFIAEILYHRISQKLKANRKNKNFTKDYR